MRNQKSREKQKRRGNTARPGDRGYCHVVLPGKKRPKKRFPDKIAAQMSVATDDQHGLASFYPCPHCKGWHVTRRGGRKHL